MLGIFPDVTLNIAQVTTWLGYDGQTNFEYWTENFIQFFCLMMAVMLNTTCGIIGNIHACELLTQSVLV